MCAQVALVVQEKAQGWEYQCSYAHIIRCRCFCMQFLHLTRQPCMQWQI
jgi:hypothetical protein